MVSFFLSLYRRKNRFSMKKTKSKSGSMKKKKKEKRNWSELAPELLDIIASKLKIYINYVQFRAVCVNWRSSTSANPPHHLRPAPWLLFPFSTDIGTYCSFWDLSTKKIHKLNLTESRGSRCCGSSLGWLVFVEECNPTIRLINPLTRNVILLPPVTAFPNVLDFNKSKLDQEYLLESSSDARQFSLSMKDMRDLFIKKVVLSSSSTSLENDYIALVILNDNAHLAFHKKGTEQWSIIKEAGESFYQDAIYYNSSFYALTAAGSIAICDLTGVSPIVTLLTLSPIPTDGASYLVDSFGQLMLVARKIELLDRDFGSESGDGYECETVYETSDSSVFKYDSTNRKWVQMNTIGDQMIFLGGNSSVCLSASDFSGCERNCVNFSCEMHKEVVHGPYYDCALYRLDDKLVEPLPCAADISSQHILHPAIWVTPNPC